MNRLRFYVNKTDILRFEEELAYCTTHYLDGRNVSEHVLKNSNVIIGLRKSILYNNALTFDILINSLESTIENSDYLDFNYTDLLCLAINNQVFYKKLPQIHDIDYIVVFYLMSREPSQKLCNKVADFLHNCTGPVDITRVNLTTVAKEHLNYIDSLGKLSLLSHKMLSITKLVTVLDSEEYDVNDLDIMILYSDFEAIRKLKRQDGATYTHLLKKYNSESRLAYLLTMANNVALTNLILSSVGKVKLTWGVEILHLLLAQDDVFDLFVNGNHIKTIDHYYLIIFTLAYGERNKFATVIKKVIAKYGAIKSGSLFDCLKEFFDDRSGKHFISIHTGLDSPNNNIILGKLLKASQYKDYISMLKKVVK